MHLDLPTRRQVLQTATAPAVSLSCLSEKRILLLPPVLFLLPPSGLLGFPHPPLPLSQHEQSMDLLFLLQPHQLFGQKIKHVPQCPSFHRGQVSLQRWQLSNEKCKGIVLQTPGTLYGVPGLPQACETALQPPLSHGTAPGVWHSPCVTCPEWFLHSAAMSTCSFRHWT